MKRIPVSRFSAALGLALLITPLLPFPVAAGRPVSTTARYLVGLGVLGATDGATRGLPASRGGALRTAALDAIADRAAATEATISALEASLGFQASMRYRYAVSGFAARLTEEQAGALRADPRVTSVAPVRAAEPAGGQVVPEGVVRVRAGPGAADPAGADLAVDVAVLDTGVGTYRGSATDGSWVHESELRLAGGTDAYGGHCDSTSLAVVDPNGYEDRNGHGTHVAGTIAARDNGIGAVGVAPGARLWSVRVFGGAGGDVGSTESIVCGLDWVASYNAGHPGEASDIDVVNMSLRGFAPWSSHEACSDPRNDDLEHLAICSLVASFGVTVVVAAGNESGPVSDFIPSRYPEVVTVSAISDFDGQPGGLADETCAPPSGPETDDTFARYSNFGDRDAGSGALGSVDITAPGTCVVSTRRCTSASCAVGDTTVMSGTSMATPHVSGAAARYLASHPGTSPAQLRERLLATASLDWDAGSDPDGTPDRLVDVEAMLAETPGLGVWATPSIVGASGDGGDLALDIAIQRAGGLTGEVELSVDELPSTLGDLELADRSLGTGELGTTLTLHLASGAPEGDHPVGIRAVGAGGILTAETSILVRVDAEPPTVSDPWPSATLRRGTWSRTAPMRLAWTASDGSGSLGRIDVQRSLDGGDWSRIARPAVTVGHADVGVVGGSDVAFRIRAVDSVGNTTVSTPLSTRLLVHESDSSQVARGAGWSTRRSGTASDGSTVTTRTRGAEASLGFSGRSVAWVSPVGPGYGRARVFLDDVPVATVDLGTGSGAARRIVFASGPLAPGPHTLRIRALGGRVDVDALLVLR